MIDQVTRFHDNFACGLLAGGLHLAPSSGPAIRAGDGHFGVNFGGHAASPPERTRALLQMNSRVAVVSFDYADCVSVCG